MRDANGHNDPPAGEANVSMASSRPTEEQMQEQRNYAGAGWLKNNITNDVSPLGEKVADLLGDVWLGIYHLDDNALKRGNWNSNHHIKLSFRGSLATVDGSRLTRLVVLCHDRMLRLDISAATHGYLALMFHQRKAREGGLMYRCPTMETQMDLIRKHYGQPAS